MVHIKIWRRIPIIPTLLYLNISKTSLSLSIGKRGWTLTVNKNGIRLTKGIPGTGVFLSEYKSYDELKEKVIESNAEEGSDFDIGEYRGEKK